ncbi:hypothetical protein KHS38_12745 [Mucilaginibacter sp. Bleaf8]|uniref:hypothetical protein n=1 Tax=Mucilaginibacter sp. Bleaf8 TaxID=2834430 RepID=UPI001BCBDB99|nr:hypothetical protein [Mucilaginibacter sp. Bleaf8]MBS7565274.1 hypothetical protein [Mucilaginibacter sp. Bleaf8]
MSAENNNAQDPNEEQTRAQTDNPGNDDIGENAGDSELSKGNTPNVQNKPDDTRVDTVTPDNDSGTPGPSTDETSNKPSDGGPANENL